MYATDINTNTAFGSQSRRAGAYFEVSRPRICWWVWQECLRSSGWVVRVSDNLFWQAIVLCSLRWPEGHARGVMCVEIIKFGSIISLLNCLVFSPGFFPGDIPLSVCMLASCLEQLVFLTSVLHCSWSVLTQCQSLCSQTDSDSCTGPRAVLTLACPPPSWWSHVCVEVSFDRWLSRVRRSSPCTGPEAEFAITCLSSRGRYWMCLRGDCGV